MSQACFQFGKHVVGASEVFFKSKLSLGLVNLKPIAPGHVLVITRRPVKRFTEMTSDEVSDLFRSAQIIGRVIEQEYAAESLTMAVQDGPAAGQTVEHVHVHVIPRRFGDWANNDDVYVELDETQKKQGSGVDNEGRKPRSKEDMAAEAEKLRKLVPEWVD